MKVMQVIPALGMGGGEIMCENLTYELIRRGHDVQVVSLYDDKTVIAERMEKNGVRVLFLHKKRGLDLGCVCRLRKAIREFRPDVIHTHLYALKYAVLAKTFLRIRCVHTVHNVAEREATKPNRRLNRVFFHIGAAVPVSLSEDVQQSVLKTYRLSPEKSPVIYNGIDLTRCVVKETYAAGTPLEIVHVGRFSEQKNHVCMIEALQKLPAGTCSISFFGEGELLDDIRKRALEAGVTDAVSFRGTTDNIYPELAKADVFILPSKWEGMPMSIIEAMGTGLPIVASDVGGVRNMITDGESGLVIEPTADALCEAILKLAASEELRRTLGVGARERSAAFSAERMAAAYEAVYNRPASGKDD